MPRDHSCPCGSDIKYSACCEPFLTSKDKPATAEQLMRSRYCAFVTENKTYLINSWHLDKRPTNIDFDPNTKWLGLKVKKCKAGLAIDSVGWVEFVARFKIAGKAERIEELSYFIKDNQQWFYVCEEDKNWEELA
tara:strand:+ start:6934 stop:7338 length:405 start_codon:yes stop_codon:yes gene_type:complete